MVNKEAKIQKLEARVYSQDQELDRVIKILLDLTKLHEKVLKHLKRLDQDFLAIDDEHHTQIEQVELGFALEIVKLRHDLGLSA